MKKRFLLPLVAAVVLGVGATTYKSDFFEIAKQIEIFTDVYKQLNMNYVDEVNPSELMDVAITAMFDHLDPYTHFWNAQDVQKARLKHSGNYTGIGAVIEGLKGKILIKQVYKDTPADKAGLKAGDKLTKIGNIALEGFDKDAGELLQGTPGTSIKLHYKRQGELHTTELKRAKTNKKLVPYHKVIADDVGYIKLTKFGRSASSEVKDALRALKSKGAKKIVLDLRGNPGGLLSEAVNTANLFVPKDQLIVSTKSIIEKYNQTFSTKHEPVDTEIPVAVLIDGHSASASEIVSGSLQDLDRAVIIGSRSFGKGLVQRPKKLKYGARMKLTISRYYTPSGRCIQALDYWHRDKDGKPVRAKAEDYNTFTTKGGRKVKDAGGIFPDVKMKTSEISGVTQALLDQNVLFDFATDYYYQHQLSSPKDFTFDDSDFRDFKSFLTTTDFHYETKTEKQLKKALSSAENEGLRDELNPAFDQLMEKIRKAEDREIDRNKAQITQQLTDAILKRYFYEVGYYDYAVHHNAEIKKATEVLDNQERYDNILNGRGE